jgi:hypothetical protein
MAENPLAVLEIMGPFGQLQKAGFQLLGHVIWAIIMTIYIGFPSIIKGLAFLFDALRINWHVDLPMTGL